MKCLKSGMTAGLVGLASVGFAAEMPVDVQDEIDQLPRRRLLRPDLHHRGSTANGGSDLSDPLGQVIRGLVRYGDEPQRFSACAGQEAARPCAPRWHELRRADYCRPEASP